MLPTLHDHLTEQQEEYDQRQLAIFSMSLDMKRQEFEMKDCLFWRHAAKQKLKNQVEYGESKWQLSSKPVM